jgi:hypothetical protein
MLGRWAPSSSEIYIRKSKAIIEKIQTRVAAEIRGALFGPDLFQEEALILAYGTHLLSAGWASGVVDTACANLKLFNSEGVHLAQLPPPAIEDSLPELSPTEVATVMGASSESETEMLPALGYFYVTLPGKGIRRLHMGGGCPLRPGIDCGRFAAFGAECPSASAYDNHCRKCWPGSAFTGATKENVDSSETGATSSATSGA